MHVNALLSLTFRRPFDYYIEPTCHVQYLWCARSLRLPCHSIATKILVLLPDMTQMLGFRETWHRSWLRKKSQSSAFSERVIVNAFNRVLQLPSWATLINNRCSYLLYIQVLSICTKVLQCYKTFPTLIEGPTELVENSFLGTRQLSKYIGCISSLVTELGTYWSCTWHHCHKTL